MVLLVTLCTILFFVHDTPSAHQLPKKAVGTLGSHCGCVVAHVSVCNADVWLVLGVWHEP